MTSEEESVLAQELVNEFQISKRAALALVSSVACYLASTEVVGEIARHCLGQPGYTEELTDAEKEGLDRIKQSLQHEN